MLKINYFSQEIVTIPAAPAGSMEENNILWKNRTTFENILPFFCQKTHREGEVLEIFVVSGILTFLTLRQPLLGKWLRALEERRKKKERGEHNTNNNGHYVGSAAGHCTYSAWTKMIMKSGTWLYRNTKYNFRWCSWGNNFSDKCVQNLVTRPFIDTSITFSKTTEDCM